MLRQYLRRLHTQWPAGHAEKLPLVADKNKCISCKMRTAVCHQEIDVMNFANKGLPKADPECVRCSACIQACPAGVPAFGRVDRAGNAVATDRPAASPVPIREG